MFLGREDTSTVQILKVSVCREILPVRTTVVPTGDVISIRSVGVMTPSEEQPVVLVGEEGSEDSVNLNTMLSLKRKPSLNIRKIILSRGDSNNKNRSLSQ